MDSRDRLEFAKIIATLSTAFNLPLSKNRADVYFEFLKDIPILSLRSAASRIILEGGRFFPAISEIRREATGTTDDQVRLEADVAWGYAIKFIKGPYHAWLSSDLKESRPREDVDKVICRAYGSWTNFMEAFEPDQIRFMRAEFVSAWARSKRADESVGLIDGRPAKALLSDGGKNADS